MCHCSLVVATTHGSDPGLPLGLVSWIIPRLVMKTDRGQKMNMVSSLGQTLPNPYSFHEPLHAVKLWKLLNSVRSFMEYISSEVSRGLRWPSSGEGYEGKIT